jgi:hypothetical protein
VFGKTKAGFARRAEIATPRRFGPTSSLFAALLPCGFAAIPPK